MKTIIKINMELAELGARQFVRSKICKVLYDAAISNNKNTEKVIKKINKDMTTWQERFDKKFIRKQDILGDDKIIYGGFPLVDDVKDFISSEQKTLLKEIVNKIDKIETTYGVSHSDSYEIGKNHGRQEYKRKVQDLIKSKM